MPDVEDSMATAGWRERFGEMAARWPATSPVPAAADPDVWRDSFAGIRAEHLRLVEQGRWLSGPRELMTVLGVTDLELPHSNVVAWLLEPTGRHGLGTGVLRRMMEVGWPDLPMPDLASAVVRREVPRDDGVRPTRADVVVWAGTTVLVIENKVRAPEDAGQCEALYRTWIGEVADVRFVLLSPDGHAPLTATSDEARTAWRAVSYRHLAGLLEELASQSDQRDTARMAVEQYREALRRLVGAPTPFAITRRD